MTVLKDLDRKGVIRAAALYVAVAFGATEILAFLSEALWSEAAAGTFRKYLAIGFIAGFPVAMYLAWTRDLGMQARRIVSAGALATLLLALLLWLIPQDTKRPEPPQSGENGIQSLAVLPLDSLSDDPEQSYFAIGMTEALIAELSQYSAFKVISRTSVMRYRNTSLSLPEIAAELGVDAIVEGSVLRAGTRVRITAQLIEAATDHHLWAESFEGEMQNILVLQNDAAQSMVSSINDAISKQPGTTSRKMVNPEAYDLYLRAIVTQLQARENPEAYIALVKRAIELDPDFAPAYALLSNIYGYLALSTTMTQEEARNRARKLALDAVRLDPRHANSRFAMARIFWQWDWDWVAAEHEFMQALQLDPNNVDGLMLYGAFRILTYGDCQGGSELIESAVARDPFNSGLEFELGVYNFHCRQYEASNLALERTLALRPDFYWAQMISAWNHLLLGSTEEAVTICDELVAEHNDPYDPYLLGTCRWVMQQAGRADRAEQLGKRVLNPPEGILVDPTILAYAFPSDPAIALDSLEQGLKQRSPNMIFIQTAPSLDPLRGEPRFQAIVETMGFPGN